MKLGLLSFSVMFGAFALAGCQHQDAVPPPIAPPPTVTSSPVPPPPPPPPQLPSSAPPAGQGALGPIPGHHMGPPHAFGDEQVYRFDFVLTPKDPKDASLTPTSFSVSIADHQSGEVMIGKNVPLGTAAAPAPGDKNVHTGGSPRMDVGLKVKAHPNSIGGSSDILVDVDLELSAVEAGGAVRKLTSHGVVVATPGKASPVVSLDDDKRHYDLVVTPTKIR